MKRIVSLIASSTEIVCALGYRAALVGRSHECDFPESVSGLPACSEPKIDVHRSSREIDESVRALVRDALSVYRVHLDTLERLRPDVILTQAQCEVCAVSLRDVEDAVCRLVASRPEIVSLEPNTLDDVYADVLRVATALDDVEAGHSLVRRMTDRIDSVAQRAAAASARPSIACIEWIDPLMVAGNWMPELVSLAGGIDPFGTPGAHAPSLSWERLVAADPDVIAIIPCGFDIARSRGDLPALTGRDEWPLLSAVRAGRVFLGDGNQYFNRPGPRLVESTEILAELLHPEIFAPAHEGAGWVRLS